MRIRGLAVPTTTLVPSQKLGAGRQFDALAGSRASDRRDPALGWERCASDEALRTWVVQRSGSGHATLLQVIASQAARSRCLQANHLVTMQAA